MLVTLIQTNFRAVPKPRPEDARFARTPKQSTTPIETRNWIVLAGSTATRGTRTQSQNNREMGRALVGVYPRPPLGIGFTLSPYPLSLLRPFPAGCWIMCKTYGKTHIIGKNTHSTSVLKLPRLPLGVIPSFLPCFTVLFRYR